MALLVFLVFSVYQRLDPTVGFDYEGHLDYLRFIDFNGSFPLADQGWEMYHPPAFWLIAVGLFEVLHRLGSALTLTNAGQAIATIAWVLEGVVAAAAVRALGGRWLGAAAAAALVWLIPGQAIVGTAVYNETTTALGVGTLLLGGLLWLRGFRVGLALLSIGFLLAELGKYSGLLAAAAALPIILWIAKDRLRPTMLALAPGLALGALYYGRNLLHFGTPLPTNIELYRLKDWDQLGWGHTAGYFTSLSSGFCAGRQSFWMGLWKWFWATDCFPIAPWRNVVETKLLIGAVLTTVFVIAALAWTAWRGRRDRVLLLVAAIPAAVLLGYVVYVVRWPALSSNKGLYLLAAAVPVAVAAGLLTDRLTRSRRSAFVGYAVMLGWGVLMVHASLG